MDDVKKDIISKTNNFFNLKHSRDILNSLFNLFDFQIALMNQIIIFNKSINPYNLQIDSLSPNKIYNNSVNNNKSSKANNLNHLIKINKDIMVSMIMKFLSKINSLLSNYKNKLDDKQHNLRNDNESLFNRGKIINLLYSENNKNFLMTNSSNKNESKYKTPKKNNNGFSSLPKLNKINSAKNIYTDNSWLNNTISSKNKTKADNNWINNTIPLNNKAKTKISSKKNNQSKIEPIENSQNNIFYKGLATDTKNKNNIKNNEKRKNKSIDKAYINKKEIVIDLNNNNLKTLFSMPIFYNSTIKTKASNED